jgi:hypothetical protein
MVLLSLIMLLAVHEEVEAVRSGYRCGALMREKEELKCRLGEVEAKYASLTTPEQLQKLNIRLGLGLKPLRSVNSLNDNAKLSWKWGE